jgi:hypothetical protein
MMPHTRFFGNADISDFLFTFDHDIELVNYIRGCTPNQWTNENHTIHETEEAALKDLCNRCVKMEMTLQKLRVEKIEAKIRQMESNDEEED